MTTVALSIGLAVGPAVADSDPPSDALPPETTTTTEPVPPSDSLPPETTTTTEPTVPTTTTTEPRSGADPTTSTTTPEPAAAPAPDAGPVEAPRDTEISIGSVSTLNGAQRGAVEAFLAATDGVARAQQDLATSLANLAAVDARADAVAARAKVAAWRLALLEAAVTVDRSSLVNLAVGSAERDGFGGAALGARVDDDPRLRAEAQREQAAAERAVARVAAERATAVDQVDAARAAADAAQDEVANAARALAAVAHGDPMVTALLTGRPPAGDAIAAVIVAAQAGQGNPPRLSGGFAMPIPSASVVSRYGFRIDPITDDVGFHPGVDITARQGTPIVAAAAGTVLLARDEDGYGNAVVLDHGSSLATLYGHMVAVAVEPGQQVAAGDVIGYVGSTGRSTGAHLHFEVRVHGVAVDPLPMLIG